MVPEGGYPHTETCVVKRGVHGGAGGGRVGTGGNRGPRIGRGWSRGKGYGGRRRRTGCGGCTPVEAVGRDWVKRHAVRAA